MAFISLRTLGFLAVVIAASSFIDTASAQAAGGQTVNLAQVIELFNRLDTNHDDKITKQEFQQIFVFGDKNGDGYLTAEEFDPATIQQLDTNKDGQLSLPEYMQAFQNTDSNKDGVITINEFRAR